MATKERNNFKWSPAEVNRGFSGGPVVKNPPCNAGDVGSIPGWEMKIPRAAEQRSLHTATTEPPLWSPWATTKDPAWHNLDPMQPNK